MSNLPERATPQSWGDPLTDEEVSGWNKCLDELAKREAKTESQDRLAVAGLQRTLNETYDSLETACKLRDEYRARYEALEQAASELLKDKLGGVHCHPCDEHDDAVKSRLLEPSLKKLYDSLHQK